MSAYLKLVNYVEYKVTFYLFPNALLPAGAWRAPRRLKSALPPPPATVPAHFTTYFNLIHAEVCHFFLITPVSYYFRVTFSLMIVKQY